MKEEEIAIFGETPLIHRRRRLNILGKYLFILAQRGLFVTAIAATFFA